MPTPSLRLTYASLAAYTALYAAAYALTCPAPLSAWLLACAAAAYVATFIPGTALISASWLRAVARLPRRPAHAGLAAAR